MVGAIEQVLSALNGNKNLRVLSLWRPEDPTLDVDLFAEEPFEFWLRQEKRADTGQTDGPAEGGDPPHPHRAGRRLLSGASGPGD